MRAGSEEPPESLAARRTAAVVAGLEVGSAPSHGPARPIPGFLDAPQGARPCLGWGFGKRAPAAVGKKSLGALSQGGPLTSCRL